MLRDTSVEWKQYDRWHVRISMDGKKTLEARFLGKGNMVLDVQCYCGVYVIYSVIVPMVMCNVICSTVYI